MEGLVDYVKRQVKCPECRAEHRVPYNGIQGFPTNITLTKFLELHADITGKLDVFMFDTLSIITTFNFPGNHTTKRLSIIIYHS